MRIHKIQLETASISRLQDFYHGILELPIQPGSEDGVVFQTGLSQLHFQENPQAKGIYHFAFNIPANQIQAAQAYLQARSVTLIRNAAGEEIIPFPNWHAQSVYFFDPAGNIVEFIARQDLQNDANQPFGRDSWLEISEIGVVTKDVWAWRNHAHTQFDLEDFDKQSAAPTFSALGSDHGCSLSFRLAVNGF